MIDIFKYPSYITQCSMKEILEKIKEEDNVLDICKNYSLSIELLRDILGLRLRGFNNAEVAQKIGVHRITVQRYMSVLKKLTQSEFQAIGKFLSDSINPGEKDERKN